MRSRISYVVNALHPGGTERLVVEMSRAFSRDFELQVICLDEPGLWATDLRREGVAVHCTWRQPGLDVQQAVRLAALFRSHGTQLIHAHQCTPWFYAALSRLLHRTPRLLLEEHGRFHPEPENRGRRLLNRMLVGPLTHRFVAVSDDIRRRLVRYEGLDAHRIEVIYNGVSTEPALAAAERQSLRESLGFSPADLVVGTVGRFDAVKNLPMLIEALALARREAGDIKGLLVGDGPEMSAVRAQIAARGLDSVVRLTGFRQDARQLVQCLDLFTLSSLSEGTSMALLEAQAAGVPVVVTAVGGNPEVVSDQQTGWVIPSGDVDSLARHILQARADPQAASRLAAAGRARYQQRFSMDSMLQAYRRIYAEMLP